MVSKRLKKFLRLSHPAESWAISEDREIHDTFMHLTGIIEADYKEALTALAKMINETEGMQDGVSDPDNAEFRHIWYEQIKIIDEKLPLMIRNTPKCLL